MNLDTDTFIFVIGVPRSGTTWLFDMIAAHDDVVSLNGSNTFLQQYVFPLKTRYHRERETFTQKGFTRGLPSKLSESEFEKLILGFIQSFYERLPANRGFYVEKATDLTSEIHKIRKYMPNSKFVHVIRDGRNSTLSRIKNRKSLGKPFGVKDLHEGATSWRKQILEARENSAGFSADMIEVKYEDLLKDPEHYLGLIFRHVGLARDEKKIAEICRQFDFNNRPVSNPTSPIANSSGDPWQPYKSEMSISEQAYFEYLAGDMLQSLGYLNKQLLANKKLRVYIKYIRVPGHFINAEISLIRQDLTNVFKRIFRIIKLVFSRLLVNRKA